MHNWYGIETETEFRRREWQRAAEADARAAQASSGRTRTPGWVLPHVALARLRSLATPRLPLTSPLTPRRPAAS